MCVFFTGENETLLGQSMVNAVLINKKIRKTKELTEHIPTRQVKPEWPCNDSVQESSPWRIHLGIHRLEQEENKTTCDVVQSKKDQINTDSGISQDSVLSNEGLLTGNEQESPSEQENSSLPEKTNGSISGRCQSSPLTSFTSPVWTHAQISASKLASASSKLPCYPFPQKKTPKISEAAIRLGLYVSQ